MTTCDVLVIGRGVIGMIAAWRAAEAGLSVTCLDPDSGAGASFAAAGMIAPVTEAVFGEQELAVLNLASAHAWPQFATEVETASGLSVGFEVIGSLTVAFDTDDARELHRVRELQLSYGLDAELLTVAAARDREPLLGPRIAAASWAATEGQVDPRKLLLALDQILERSGVQTVPVAIDHLLLDDHGAVVGAVDSVGTEHRATETVLAAGLATTGLVADLPGIDLPIRSVKGQILRLDASELDWLRGERIVRGFVQGRPVYVVGRADGEVVVGATSEEWPDDRHVTAGGVFGILRDARALVPGLDEAPLRETLARSRPATPDNLPYFGRCDRAGLIVAAGHYRHGILLSAITAHGFDDLWAGRSLDDIWSPAAPGRFVAKEAR